MNFADKLIKGLTLLRPFIERAFLDYVPSCYDNGTPKHPSVLYLVVEPNVMEVQKKLLYN